MKLPTPTKPATQAEKVDMLWDGFYNHLPHWLNLLDTKINFLLGFIGIVMALVSIVFGIALLK